MIENQYDIPKTKWRYGLRSSAATGCGWIATCNALEIMGYSVEVEPLIRYYESQLPLIHGNFGTTLFGPALLFHRWGFPVRPFFVPARFDEAARKADACILFYHWLDKGKYGSHFVALHHTEKGFVGYNTFRNSEGPDDYGPSLRDFLKKQKYFAPVLICIRDKRSG